jgi:hypothetical protein
MKKISFLSGRERKDRPPLALSIFLSVIFFSSPISGLLNPGKVLNVTEKHHHDNPQGFYTFFVLVPDKNFQGDTTKGNKNNLAVKELAMDTTPENPKIQKNINLVIW